MKRRSSTAWYDGFSMLSFCCWRVEYTKCIFSVRKWNVLKFQLFLGWNQVFRCGSHGCKSDWQFQLGVQPWVEFQPNIRYCIDNLDHENECQYCRSGHNDHVDSTSLCTSSYSIFATRVAKYLYCINYGKWNWHQWCCKKWNCWCCRYVNQLPLVSVPSFGREPECRYCYCDDYTPFLSTQSVIIVFRRGNITERHVFSEICTL